MKKALIVRSGEGDWEALYIDGVKVYENHSIPNRILLEKLGVDVSCFDHPELEDPDQCNPLEMFPPVWKAN